MNIDGCLLHHNRRLISSPRIYLAHCYETIVSGEIPSEKSAPVAHRWINNSGHPLCLPHPAVGLNCWQPQLFVRIDLEPEGREQESRF